VGRGTAKNNVFLIVYCAGLAFLRMMDEWYDILPHVRNKQLVWYCQCSQLFHANAARYIQFAKGKKKGLVEVAKEGDLKGVKYLVERCGADVHAEDDYALRCASKKGHLEVVEYLTNEDNIF